MPSYRITRWTRLLWWLSDWAPFYYESGERHWMTPWAYAALIWDRFVGRRSWPLLKDPERPKRRFLIVPFIEGPPPGACLDYRGEWPKGGSDGPA